METKPQHCPHCLPRKVKSHFPQRIEYYSQKVGRILAKIRKLLPTETRKVTIFGMKLLQTIGIVRYVSEIDRNRIKNRHAIFFDEAKKRNIEISNVTFFGYATDEFLYIWNGRKYFYEGNPMYSLPYQPTLNVDDKYEVKRFLAKNQIPVANGNIFIDEKEALNTHKTFPLVVKPRAGSLSAHVTTNIQSASELKKAIDIVQKYRKDFIVERHVDGKLYRATVIGKKHVFVCEKDGPNVVGDGTSTIQELVTIKNKLREGNPTLHKINVDKKSLLETVPSKGKKVYLNSKATLSVGCDIINCTNEAHEDNVNLFIRIAELTNTQVVGVDFICEDISISYTKQDSAVLELNSLPYIDMHQYPSHGKSISVAKIVWDFVLEKLSVT